MSWTIIVPLDTSPASEVALPIAEALARRIDARLCLLSVIGAPVEFAVWLRAQETIDAWAKHNLEVDEYLTGVADGIAGLQVDTTVSTGNPSPEIVGFAAQQDNSIIVMASHARTGLDRITIGNVATTVLHSATCPVIVVRESDDEVKEAPVVGPLDRIVVALDGSEFAEGALAKAQEVLGSSDLTIHLLRVVETSKWFGSTAFDMSYDALELYIQAAYEETNDYLQKVARNLRDAGHTVTWEACDGLVADEITRAAKERKAGLIVMSTHGRTGLGRVFIGSVAERVVHDTDRPVFLVNPNATKN